VGTASEDCGVDDVSSFFTELSADASTFATAAGALLDGSTGISTACFFSLFVFSGDVIGCSVVFGGAVSAGSSDFVEVALLGVSVDSEARDSSLFVVSVDVRG
jgi:hypothetical protein